MRIGGIREEVLNVYLALALKERGLVAIPEQHLSDALPNVLVSFNRLRGHRSSHPHPRPAVEEIDVLAVLE